MPCAAENAKEAPVIKCGRVTHAGRPFLAFMCQHCARAHFHDISAAHRPGAGPTAARCKLPASPYLATGYFLKETT